MKQEDIHIGDVLRIREWHDMEKEFGLNRDGEINCRFVFVPSMRPLCGQRFTVKTINSNDTIISEEGIESDGRIWHISADMLELCDEYDQIAEESLDGLFVYLFGAEGEQ